MKENKPNKDTINQWLEAGQITEEQAQFMLADIKHQSSKQKSNKAIGTISTIGVTCLGIGVILLIATNWQYFSEITKLMTILGSAYLTLIFGYLLKYHSNSWPKSAGALILLSTILYIASIGLITQIYHINPENNFLRYVMLAGVLPVAYLLHSKAAAIMSMPFLISQVFDYVLYSNKIDIHSFKFYRQDALDLFVLIPIITGILFYSVGKLHVINKRYVSIGRVYSIVGLYLSFCFLYILTFDTSNYSLNIDLKFLIIVIITLIINMYLYRTKDQQTLIPKIKTFFKKTKNTMSIKHYFSTLKLKKTNKYFSAEQVQCLLFIITMIVIFIGYSKLEINILFFILTVSLVLLGIKQADSKKINVGTLFLVIFIMTKYFENFWTLMSRSAFFMIGGILFLILGFAMESKRRKWQLSIEKERMKLNEK